MSEPRRAGAHRVTVLLAIGAGMSLALGCYALIAALQANGYEGERATANLRFWGPIAGFFLLLGVYLAFRMYRAVLLEIRRHLT